LGFKKTQIWGSFPGPLWLAACSKQYCLKNLLHLLWRSHIRTTVPGCRWQVPRRWVVAEQSYLGDFPSEGCRQCHRRADSWEKQLCRWRQLRGGPGRWKQHPHHYSVRNLWLHLCPVILSRDNPKNLTYAWNKKQQRFITNKSHAILEITRPELTRHSSRDNFQIN